MPDHNLDIVLARFKISDIGIESDGGFSYRISDIGGDIGDTHAYWVYIGYIMKY